VNVVDHLRVEWAVQSYGFWLDLRGASGRRRRALSHELRANLREAGAEHGASAAVRALGSRRAMAEQAIVADPSSVRWTAGAQAALVALAVVVFVEVLASLAWLDGVQAAKPVRAVTGSMALFPGSSLTYEPLVRGFSISMSPGWLALAVALVTMVIVSKPWRLVTGRGARSARAGSYV